MSFYSEVKVVNDIDIFLVRQVILALHEIHVDIESSDNIVTAVSE